MYGKQQQQQMGVVAPKGCVTVRVGAEGEEQRRFAVPLGHLSHPLFGELLDEAEREYGFKHPGAIAIPCRVDRFVHLEHLIDQDLHHHHGHGGGSSHHHHLIDLDAAENGTGDAHHHHHHHSSSSSSQIHLHLPRFAGCFRA
uniref:Auxin-responsive protein SAUR32 n=1 Tax=Leersia perrieri TaxID=77586 RepID=A0A0D9XLF7_9ORYZ